MAIEWTAYALIGVKVALTKTPVLVRERGCGHDLPDGAAFCPRCGRPAFVERTETPGLWELRDKLERAFEDGRLTCCFDYDGTTLHAGYGVSADRDDEDGRSVDLVDPDEIKGELEDVLAPLGLWTAEVEASFALRCVMIGG